MGFTYPYADWPFDDYYEVELLVKIEDPKGGHAWKALMATTYETLSRNKEPHFKELEIRRLVWTYVEPFKSAEFHELLAHMERFTLSVRGGENGAGWRLNTCLGYAACVAKFDELFFNHLASATVMTLKAPFEGPIGLEGLEGMHFARLALKEDQMPRLRELHLEYCFVCGELADFVKSHAGTLEKLTLQACACSIIQMNSAVYWKDLFTVLGDSNPTKLATLNILPLDPPLTMDDQFGMERRNESAEVQEVRRVLTEDPRRRLFLYATLMDKYGDFDADEDGNVEAFWKGDDQVAYDKLMEKVKVNAKMTRARLERSF